MATALLADGSRLYADLTGATTYAEIAECTEISNPAGSPDAPSVDTTSLYRTDNVRTSTLGLTEPGEFTFKQYYTAARYTALNTPYLARTAVSWRPSLPDNATPASASLWKFPGKIKGLMLDDVSDPDGKVLIVCKVKITGAIVFTAGS